MSVEPQDAVFVYSSSHMSEALILLMTDLPDACAAIGEGLIDPEVFEVPLRAPDAQVLSWSVTGRLGDSGPDIIGPALVPAFFGELGPPGELNAYPMVRSTDAACESTAVEGAAGSSGELVIEALSLGPGGHMRGHFEVRQSDEVLRGSFDAALCELPPAVEPPACP